MRSGFPCCIFPRVEFCVIFFCVWNALWYFVLYSSVCVTCSGISDYIFLHVERALVFCVIYFLSFLFILCCIIIALFFFIFPFLFV